MNKNIFGGYTDAGLETIASMRDRMRSRVAELESENAALRRELLIWKNDYRADRIDHLTAVIETLAAAGERVLLAGSGGLECVKARDELSNAIKSLNPK